MRWLRALPWLILVVVLFPFAVLEWLLTPAGKRRPYQDFYWYEEDLYEDGEEE